MELRDVDSGNKVNERLRTDEPVESMNSLLVLTKMGNKRPSSLVVSFISYLISHKDQSRRVMKCKGKI